MIAGFVKRQQWRKAKKQLEVETISAVADKGYESRADILECIYDGTAPTVALKYDKKERSYELPYEAAEITEEERVSTKRKDIEKCLKAGVLPKIYEGTGITVEVVPGRTQFVRKLALKTSFRTNCVYTL